MEGENRYLERGRNRQWRVERAGGRRAAVVASRFTASAAAASAASAASASNEPLNGGGRDCFAHARVKLQPGKSRETWIGKGTRRRTMPGAAEGLTAWSVAGTVAVTAVLILDAEKGFHSLSSSAS